MYKLLERSLKNWPISRTGYQFFNNLFSPLQSYSEKTLRKITRKERENTGAPNVKTLTLGAPVFSRSFRVIFFFLSEIFEKVSFDPCNFRITRLSARKSEQMKNFRG